MLPAPLKPTLPGQQRSGPCPRGRSSNYSGSNCVPTLVLMPYEYKIRFRVVRLIAAVINNSSGGNGSGGSKSRGSNRRAGSLADTVSGRKLGDYGGSYILRLGI